MIKLTSVIFVLGFPGGLVVKKKERKNLPANAGDARDTSSIPGWRRSLGEGNGNSLQYSCLEIPRQRSLVGYSQWGHKESDMTEHEHILLSVLKNHNSCLTFVLHLKSLYID